MTAEDDNSGIENGCCSAVYLDTPSNVFRHSDGVNGRVSSLGGNRFKVSDFPINPYASTGSAPFKIERFSFSDKAGNRAVLSANSPNAEFYVDQNGNQTNIKVLTFSIKQNQQSDIRPPQITSLVLDKDAYAPGESLVFRMNSVDDVSGVAEGCCSAVWVTPSSNVFKNSDNVNGFVRDLGNGNFQVSSFQINEFVDTSVSEFVVSGFSVKDKAGNKAELRLRKPDDATYSDQNGKLTSISVIRFQIK